ncbi:hypothetical protein M408DRAFT_325348 [Serendipita vermifera MAFF 305830]|uniref:Calpain catalytic domain-containing protein n=1 Tax=Serendipita vermifera MAFF 305830 TaxID=933852 RepID=A0A0C3BAA9_SERVB|nr:hypothetical protein M408DRAFT_325348 [Serendipita vermifera MAFF 305830]
MPIHNGSDNPKDTAAKNKQGKDNVKTSNAKTKAKARAAAKKKAKRSFKQPTATVGIAVTEELDIAIARCRAKVETISKLCRARNRKFRDTEFDLENDKDICLQGLAKPDDEALNPADVMRVTDIFDNPQFFIDGASSSDVVQGALGDCWFLSAIANVSSVPGLIEKICVARDEAVGVYGFIFFRDAVWVDVIIDDQLFVEVPKYESLTPDEQKLYHHDPDLYYSVARKGSKILYFASSRTEGETWVPLIEKAYAKLHGNYAYISGGKAMEGIEDLTGGVCYSLPLVDILDPNKLWEELSQPNRSILYGCALQGLDNERSLNTANRVHGLVTGHAYTVLHAKEYNGKRFVVVRNPWGTGEWKGRWSDGSKEWTKEWLPALSVLDHSFGNDGQFIMEYSDFLRNWSSIDCTRLFDASWAFSSIWVEAGMFSSLHPWTWGDVSFTISVPEDTPAVIVLQQADDRYFQEISGFLQYDYDFVVFKKGSTEVYATSNNSERWNRSQNCELRLEAGEYVVHVSISTDTWEDVMPTALETVGGYDLTQLEIKMVEDKRDATFKKKAMLTAQATDESQNEGGETQDEEMTEQPSEPEANEPETEETVQAQDPSTAAEEATNTAPEAAEPNAPAVHPGITCDLCKMLPITGIRYKCASPECPDFDLCQGCMEKKEHDQTHELLAISVPRVKRVEHANVMCNMCSECPIIGVRYKCQDAECPDFDMCSACLAKGEHPATHSLLMMPVPPAETAEEDDDGTNVEPEVFNGVGCDGCGTNPIVAPRFNLSCPNYDLCENCAKKGIHPADHQLLQLDSPEEAQHLRPGAQGASLLLGLRVYTLKSSNTTLGAQMRHGYLNRGIQSS